MADSLHRLRREIFIILFALAWHTEWSLLLHDVIGDWIIPFAANATAAVKIANAFEWPGQPPKIAPSPLGICNPCNTWFIGPTWVFIQNGISIGSAVFAQLNVECPITLQWAATFLPKIALPSGPPSNTWYYSPPESSSQMASWSVLLFLYRSQMLCCTMHCQWGRNPQNCPFPLGYRHPAEGGPSHSHRQHAQKVW